MNSSPDGSEEAKALQKAAHTASRSLLKYFERKKLWLPRECCDKVEAFTKELWHLQVTRHIFSYDREGSDNFIERRNIELQQAWTSVQESLPAAREALAEELRRLLDPGLSRVHDERTNHGR